MVKILTFVYDGKPNTVNKIAEKGLEYTGVLNTAFNVLHPVVTFRTKEPVNFNYVYVTELNRYYFVAKLIQSGNICTIHLDIDVLMTYKDKILSSSGTLTKGENTNKYLSNRTNVVDVRPNIRKLDFPNKNLINEKGSIIMVTIKGNV